MREKIGLVGHGTYNGEVKSVTTNLGVLENKIRNVFSSALGGVVELNLISKGPYLGEIDEVTFNEGGKVSKRYKARNREKHVEFPDKLFKYKEPERAVIASLAIARNNCQERNKREKKGKGLV